MTRMAQPVLFVVVESAPQFERLIADLRRRFGVDYHVRGASSVRVALTTLTDLADRTATDPNFAHDRKPELTVSPNGQVTMLVIGTPANPGTPEGQRSLDRLRGELDYEVNRRSETEVQALATKLNAVVDLLRSPHNFIESPDTAMQMILSVVGSELIFDRIQGKPAPGDPVRIARVLRRLEQRVELLVCG